MSMFFSMLANRALSPRPYKRQLAYLESTGTQYIDTGVYFDPQQDFEAEATSATLGNARAVILSSYYSGSYSSLALEWGSSSQGHAYTPCAYVQVNNIFDLWDGVQTVNTPVAINARWDHLDKRVIMDVNGTSYNLHNSTVSLGAEGPYSIWLFLDHRANPSAIANPTRLYSVSLRKGGSLVRNLIPVLDWNDRPAMYDKVSGQFFYNQGTGEFLYPMEDDDAFTIDLAITADNLQFGVQPYWNTGGYCNVDWGDGTVQAATTSGAQLTHTYAAAGNYRVKVRGDMYRFRVGSTNPAAVIDCNGNWEALGEITNGNIMFQGCSNAVFAFIDIPEAIENIGGMFWVCLAASLNISRLPASITTLNYVFNGCQRSRIDLDSIGALWENPLPLVTDITAFCYNAGNVAGGVVGSVAGFMRKLPNVTSVALAFSTAVAGKPQTFGSDDYFEIVLTTTEANQSWGFTAISSAGRWYCFDWGDGTAVTANKNLDVFTSGEKVTHTFATPGTYKIKLATAPCQIVFDPYDSDNGNWAALGLPADGLGGVFVKEGTEVVSSTMVMSGATITSGQSQYVYNHGTVLDDVALSGAFIYPSAGVVSGLYIQSATMSQFGGVVSDVNASGGRIVVSGGTGIGFVADGRVELDARASGVISSVIVRNVIICDAATGGAMYDVTLLSGGGRIRGAGSMFRISVNGALVVSSGGYAEDIVISGGRVYDGINLARGSLIVSGNASASKVVVSSGGSLTVSSGGSALAVTSNAGAVITVMDGGYIEYTT